MKLFNKLNINLNKINTEIINIFKDDTDLDDCPMIRDNLIDMVNTGGKRLRPLFVIEGGKFGPDFKSGQEKLYRIAALSEILHLASLIHDDIIDNSHIRRGHPSLHKKTNAAKAAFIADYAVNRVSELLLHEPDEQALKRFHKMSAAMCGGEIQQIKYKFNFNQNFYEYLEKSSNKTAAFISECFNAGSAVTGAETAVRKQLYRFGYNIGISFQIIDDILDFTQTDNVLGKPAGKDFMSGNITLPVLYALEDNKIRSDILQVNENTDKKTMKKVICKIQNSRAIDKCYKMSRKFTNNAFDCINKINCSKQLKNELHYIIEFVDNRIY